MVIGVLNHSLSLCILCLWLLHGVYSLLYLCVLDLVVKNKHDFTAKHVTSCLIFNVYPRPLHMHLFTVFITVSSCLLTPSACVCGCCMVFTHPLCMCLWLLHGVNSPHLHVFVAVVWCLLTPSACVYGFSMVFTHSLWMCLLLLHGVYSPPLHVCILLIYGIYMVWNHSLCLCVLEFFLAVLWCLLIPSFLYVRLLLCVDS